MIGNGRREEGFLCTGFLLFYDDGNCNDCDDDDSDDDDLGQHASPSLFQFSGIRDSVIRCAAPDRLTIGLYTPNVVEISENHLSNINACSGVKLMLRTSVANGHGTLLCRGGC